METLAATPGIDSVGAVSSLPLNPVGIDYDLPVIVQGRPRPRAGRGAAGRFPHRHAGLLPHDAHRAQERPAVHRIRRPRRDSGRDHQRDHGEPDVSWRGSGRPAAAALRQAARNRRRRRVGQASRLQPRPTARNGGAQPAVPAWRHDHRGAQHDSSRRCSAPRSRGPCTRWIRSCRSRECGRWRSFSRRRWRSRDSPRCCSPASRCSRCRSRWSASTA